MIVRLRDDVESGLFSIKEWMSILNIQFECGKNKEGNGSRALEAQSRVGAERGTEK